LHKLSQQKELKMIRKVGDSTSQPTPGNGESKVPANLKKLSSRTTHVADNAKVVNPRMDVAFNLRDRAQVQDHDARASTAANNGLRWVAQYERAY